MEGSSGGRNRRGEEDGVPCLCRACFSAKVAKCPGPQSGLPVGCCAGARGGEASGDRLRLSAEAAGCREKRRRGVAVGAPSSPRTAVPRVHSRTSPRPLPKRAPRNFPAAAKCRWSGRNQVLAMRVRFPGRRRGLKNAAGGAGQRARPPARLELHSGDLIISDSRRARTGYRGLGLPRALRGLGGKPAGALGAQPLSAGESGTRTLRSADGRCRAPEVSPK